MIDYSNEGCPTFMLEAQKKAAKAHLLDFVQLKSTVKLKTLSKFKPYQIDELINNLNQIKQTYGRNNNNEYKNIKNSIYSLLNNDNNKNNKSD